MTARAATLPRPVLPVAPAFTPPAVRIINCDTCHADMPHALNKSGTAYVCSCGTELEYHINDSPATWAIR
jgi:hypothetical protein